MVRKITSFEKANEKVHPVETQWHHKILIPLGWVAKTKEGVGFVRHYDYTFPGTDLVIRCTTGASADYWEEITHNSGHGYWRALEKFAKEVDKAK